MKKEIIYLVLAISLAFNLAFIGMFIWHRSHRPAPPHGQDFPLIRKYIKENPQRFKGEREKFVDYRRDFIEYLRSDNFEEAKADSLLEEMLGKQHEMERRIGNELIELRKKGEKPEKRPPHPHFDQNRNNPKRRRK